MIKLKLALDWTPNINHVGFFVAKELGYYTDGNIDLEITSPADDNYAVTPAKKVELGEAHFALCPTESLISYQTKTNPFKLKAIGAIYREDVSAIVAKSSTAERPKDLDGKSYASYKARYEDEIVKQMIKNDGGQGTIEIQYPDKLGIWNTLLNDKADSTWIFLNWEGVEADKADEELSYFKMKDFNVPYSYSPVIATNEDYIDTRFGELKSFIEATKKGFLYSKDNPKKAIEILSKHIPENDQHIDLYKALEVSANHFGDENNWGKMDDKVIENFLQWIYQNKMEKVELRSSDLFTNKLFD